MKMLMHQAALACALALAAACASTAGSPTPAPSSAVVEAGSGETGLPGQGEPCKGGKCAPGLTCLGYFGVAGARGPRFTSCEIPCRDTRTACPEGQTCVTIADGPGRVCRDER